MAPRTVVISAPDPTAGHYGPMPPLETPGHSQASLAQSLVGSLLLSPGPDLVPTRFVVSSKNLFFWGGSVPCQISSLKNLLWALELLQQCKNLFAIIVLQFVGCLLGGSMVVLNGDLLQ